MSGSSSPFRLPSTHKLTTYSAQRLQTKQQNDTALGARQNYSIAKLPHSIRKMKLTGIFLSLITLTIFATLALAGPIPGWEPIPGLDLGPGWEGFKPKPSTEKKPFVLTNPAIQSMPAAHVQNCRAAREVQMPVQTRLATLASMFYHLGNLSRGWGQSELPDGRHIWSARLAWQSYKDLSDHCIKACLGPAASYGFDAALCHLRTFGGTQNGYMGYTPNPGKCEPHCGKGWEMYFDGKWDNWVLHNDKMDGHHGWAPDDTVWNLNKGWTWAKVDPKNWWEKGFYYFPRWNRDFKAGTSEDRKGLLLAIGEDDRLSWGDKSGDRANIDGLEGMEYLRGLKFDQKNNHVVITAPEKVNKRWNGTEVIFGAAPRRNMTRELDSDS
ncbi:MAG: hypothetical protein MMC23_008144 [Stictis urceolatum]|nr:hypothetical protein [Stictis urceolata]